MGRIKILPDIIANKIAAGEVVERPSSVVKELLENSLDADATRIRLEVEAGGKRRIHIVDDGCGMVRDDALLAFERHATSKLRSADDLLSISTLGFRGEALPSIGAVSRLLLETRAREETSGTRVEIAGGRVLNVQEVGLPAGTSITVSNLFYNIPARRRFLRSEATELSHITSTVTHYALAHPEIAFVLNTAAGELINVSPVASVRERVFQLFGEELLADLVEFGPRQEKIFVTTPEDDSESEDLASNGQAVTLSGFLSRPQVQKLNRNSIYIFVNRRLIRDRVILHAVQQAYRNVMPPNCYPVALLFLELPYGEVDVNVHPSKIEVRFRHQSFVHDLVRDTMRECLTVNKPISTFPVGASWAPEIPNEPAISDQSYEPVSAPARPDASFTLAAPPRVDPPPVQQRLPQTFDCSSDVTTSARRTADSGPTAAASESELSELRPLGQINESFIVAASPTGLWLVDQHVAHERVLFEKFLAQRDKGIVESQRLLMPHVLRLTVAQMAVWDQVVGELESAGFEAERFGQNTIAVKAAPAGVKADEVEKLLSELIESLESESRSVSPQTVRQKVAASVACHAAIKINTPLDQQKMQWLLEQLAATQFPMSCPHGRPVLLKYEMREILKAFHRI
ncbi:MAG: DNA mismatch repair endonuclease MutL [Acidobacteria bacterium]|nr:DNA mismatch repair endonuclease MutL [Acidobacteriota bacterium]